MTKRFPGKLLPVWLAISAALILAGIILMAIFGFHYAAAERKTVEISFDAVVTIEEKDDALETLCEDAFENAKLSYSDKRVSNELNSSYITSTGNKLLTYTFDGKTDDAAIEAAVKAIRDNVSANADFANAEIVVSAHTLAGEKFFEAAWRGGVALGVAAIVGLIYIGFRFGIGQAVAGLAACVNDTMVTLAVLAITRIPVYAYTPVLLAGIAAVISLIAWLAQCMKMRENFKDPAYASLSAQEAVGESCATSWKFLLCFLAPIACAFIVFGAVATSGLRLFAFTALIPIALSLYSSFLLAPATLVPLKSKFDKMKIRRKRYVGKKAADKATNAEE